MLNWDSLELYKENNRIEAKKALGGLPESIWETCSAFANTLGGVILLGVEELEDKSLHAIDLPEPQALIDRFKELLNDPKCISVNHLRDDDIRIQQADDAHIVSIFIPPAPCELRPVYINGDLYRGSYRRDGEGDYRCSLAEVEAMLKAADKEHKIK